MNTIIRILILLAVSIQSLGASIQQTTLTTNKLTLGVGLTNLPTAAPTVLSLSVSAGTNIVLVTNAGVLSFNVAPTNAGSGDNVFVNHSAATDPNFTNSTDVTWALAGSNVTLTLNAIYQPTNTALTALAGNPSLYQATNGNLTLLSAYGPTTWQATNAALTALAGNPNLYQATNSVLTTLASLGPNAWQATNANLTALANNPQLYQATNANLTILTSNDGSYLTNSVPGGATNQYQFVTLKQLNESVSGGTVSYFNTLTPADGFTSSGTVIATNWMATGLPAQNTNAAATAANGQYIAMFVSTNTFTTFASGQAVVEIYVWENSGGAGSITAEAYILNSVTMAEEYEFTPAPAYQSFPDSATPQKLTFGIPVSDYTSTTNLHFAIKIKVQESGTDPTIRIVTGGSYPSHVAFAVPSGAFVNRTGDTMTGLLAANGGLSVGVTNIITELASKANTAGAGDDVWVNHANVSNPNFTNAVAAEITWTVSGTNVVPELAASVTRDSELSSFLTEASASALYQGTNANLTLLQAYGPTAWQATNANLTLLQAYGPTTWQATNAALTALAANPNLYQATNANLTLLQAYGPTTWQATNAALTALAGNPQLYQATNAALTALSANPQLYQATNAALTALAANPQLYQATNANLTAWAALATSAKQDADADLTTWAGITPAANVGTFLATPSSANLRGAVTDESGTGVLIFAGGDVGSATATTPAANDDDTSVATTAFVTSSTTTFTGKTYDSAGTGNVLKQTKHLILQRPDYTDGSGAVLVTNTLGASGLMHCTFSGNAETNANWAVYEFTCPPDLDTAGTMTATFSFLSGGTDTDDYVFHLTCGQVASGTAYPTGTGIASLPIVMTVNTVTEANDDIQTSSATTLTGWAAALTPGTPMAIRVARLQNAQDDGARDVCLVIAYGATQ